jgi:hypothetical protein
MLPRSLWSSLILSAAVATVGLCGVTTLAQETAPAAAPAPEAASAPVAAPSTAAAAPAPEPAPAAAEAPAAPAVPAIEDPVKLADDLLHFSLVNNVELAKANADKLLDKKLTATEMLQAFEAASAGRDFRTVLEQDLRRPDLKDSVAKLLEQVDEGYRNVARDPVRIRGDIDRLGGGPRAYQNAKDRLGAAGQYAVPIYLEYLQNPGKKDLYPFIIRVMGEIGRPLLNPLIEELRVSDPTLRVELANVIGQIGYPQALPALRLMQTDAQTPPQLKAAVDQAIALIDRSGRVASMSPAELYLAGGENYYDRKSSYLPMQPEEKTNPIWSFDKNLNNVAALQVPTEIWNSVMALRSAEAALKIDPNNGAAISLWLAANLKREIQLPQGAKDPSKPAAAQDAAFYAKAAGPAYMNPVLARALDNNDPALALRAIAGLEATGGVAGLVNSPEAPLVRALANPDRAVRFTAAFALARANPLSQYPAFFRVVPILSEAVGTTAAPAALLVVANEDQRNALSEALRNGDAHYTVYAGSSISAALEQARRAATLDVVIVPNGPEVARIADMARTDYRLTGVPVLVSTPSEEAAAAKLKFAQNKGYAVIEAQADEAAVTAALAQARKDIGSAPVTAESANAFALTALRLLDMLASDHRSIYSANEATVTLIDALRDKRPEVVAAAAGVIGKLNSAEGERALALAALNTDADAALRVTFFHNLAESAKRTGNALDGAQVTAVIKIVTSAEGDAKVRDASAEALGALNVPSNQASTLILQQAR